MGNKQRNTAKGTIAYNHFMYLEELRRPAKQPLRQSQSKMELTLCLLRTNLRNLSNFNTTELTELNQLLVLKEDLRKDIQNKTVVKKQKKSKDRWYLATQRTPTTSTRHLVRLLDAFTYFQSNPSRAVSRSTFFSLPCQTFFLSLYFPFCSTIY
ncbi:uncharacterized protein LOC128861365 isoform X4 [Anastrepha ludens]|uniref:uncharacterized protein LOC128861365 isoform X4 n=1 Tax=Anastrepha ludens TaxID=28586 RepID=UPI0023AF0BDC|nr:uncharacterized protein LOC128861365 isoform X4 [Anastrepha ludens]XP_053955442.1 uncharacterized protein LOC128861365 isoform X4 [Anastrepha ludens]